MSGTVNPWGGLGPKKCGDPEPAMQYPSPGRPDAPGADDAQFRLALTRNFGQPCPKHEYPGKESAFQVNLGQGWFHPVAVNNPSHPSGDVRGRQHPYTFQVTGLGAPAEFRYADCGERGHEQDPAICALKHRRHRGLREQERRA